ncbi:MAG: hypothetical protein WC303_03765 [Candidatus Paceibacterota bacterium]|jgi:hypothetical protein
MSRPDTYIIKLDRLKTEIDLQIMHCKITLNKLTEIKLDTNYEGDAVSLEKSNVDSLITLISDSLQTLEGVRWE